MTWFELWILGSQLLRFSLIDLYAEGWLATLLWKRERKRERERERGLKSSERVPARCTPDTEAHNLFTTLFGFGKRSVLLSQSFVNNSSVSLHDVDNERYFAAAVAVATRKRNDFISNQLRLNFLFKIVVEQLQCLSSNLSHPKKTSKKFLFLFWGKRSNISLLI